MPFWGVEGGVILECSCEIVYACGGFSEERSVEFLEFVGRDYIWDSQGLGGFWSGCT